MTSSTPTLDYAAHWLVCLCAVAAAVLVIRRLRKAPSRGRLLVGNAVVLVAALSFAAALGETYLRYIYDGTNWYAATNTMRAWFDRHVEINRNGYRDAPFDTRSEPGVTRVAFWGDSFTFGYGIKNPEDRFTDLIRAELQRESPGKFDVWNLGVIGSQTGQALEVIRDTLTRVRIDRIVLMYSPNDVEDLLEASARDEPPFEPAEPGSLRARSFLLDHLLVLEASARPDVGKRYFDALDDIHTDDTKFARQAVRFQQLADLCRAAGTKLDVAIFPLISHWGPDYPFDAWHDKIESAWRKAGITPVDLRPAFEGLTLVDLRVGALDPHPNELANRLVAKRLMEQYFGR